MPRFPDPDLQHALAGDCRRCPALAESRERISWGNGPQDADLLADAGHGPEECYFTNAVKCFPADGDGGNREPTAEERANCRPHLRREIEAVEPRVVVPTGKHATKSTLALDGRTIAGFLDCVLEPVECPDLGVTVVPLLHPSYQDVWLPRLGHDDESYRAAIAETLADHGTRRSREGSGR